ncbi:transglutaminase family protein [uncultured Sphingomonas sp.]|uniref:transglutaminase-like domain-containing protein n=1 Tax=uncultured Sphingomonas sp. TaxID=158754 RepID=UPI0025E7B669|nr:transglutaminase family protein [uncultured Sphingomonas sp.]
MRLFVRHRTHYRFQEPQARLVQLLRMTPGDHAGQNVASWSIDVDRDVRLKPARDGYGNATTMLYVDGPLDGIVITVAGEVLTEDRAGLVSGTPEPLPPLAFLQPTPATAADAAIRDFVADLHLATDPLTGAHMLAEAIHDRMVLEDPRLDDDHRAAAVFASGRSDARGLAQLLIAAARTAGYPARYVAGHLFRPYEAETKAAHGWAELYVDGYGWIGFDAHEGRCPTDCYVRVAVGLDHREAAPVAGARIGGGGEVLDINVHVGLEPPQPD